MPESRPAAKQLASLLNETERTASGVETSIGGRTFILSCMLLYDVESGGVLVGISDDP